MPSTPSARTNAQWIADLTADAAGSSAAQADLRAHLSKAVRKAARTQGVRDEALLEDLLQAAILRVMEVLDRFEDRSQFTTWAWSVAVRSTLTELRKPGVRPESSSESIPDRAEAAPGPAESATRQEIVDALLGIIDEELTDRQRTAIVGELEGKPQAALLEELGIQRNALYKLQHDARAKLRAGLTAAGFCDNEVRDAFDL